MKAVHIGALSCLLLLFLMVHAAALAAAPTQVPFPHAVMPRPSIALVLGGGGTRGAAHIGILRVLKEAGIKVDSIVGCSMGAIVGGLYAAGVPLDRIEQICVDGELEAAYAPGAIWPRALFYYCPKLGNPFRKSSYSGLFSGEKLEQFLARQLPADKQTVESLPVSFSCVATNLLDGRPYLISHGPLARAIRASSTMPPILKPVEMDGRLLVDGGLSSGVRSFSAKQLGTDIVIAVSVDSQLPTAAAGQFHSARFLSRRVKNIELQDSYENNPGLVDLVVHPQVDGIALMSNRSSDFRQAVRAGEQAAREALPQIQQVLARQESTVRLSNQEAPRGETSPEIR